MLELLEKDGVFSKLYVLEEGKCNHLQRSKRSYTLNRKILSAITGCANKIPKDVNALGASP